MQETESIKKCGACGREFKTEQDVLQFGSCWRICSRGFLWFNCTCDSTLMVAKGKFDWYSPEKLLNAQARSIFNALPTRNKLPNISSAVMELQQLIQDENVTSKHLANAAKKEPVIAANILKIANGFNAHNRSKKIESLDHAISYVGHRTIGEMISIASIQTFATQCKIFNAEHFWQESLLAGRIAERLASEFSRLITPDDAYIAGCLFNIGKIVMSILFPEEADRIARDEQDPLVLSPWIQGEAKYRTTSHRVLGEIGASFWGMPDFVSEAAIAHHRMPTHSGLESITIGDITCLANQLTHWLSLDPHKIDMKLMLKSAAKFGLSTESLLDSYVEKISFLREAS